MPIVVAAAIGVLLWVSGAFAQVPRWRCPGDSVRVGTACVDKYEASVWTIPADNPKLLRKVRLGRATLQDLTSGGAVQLGAFVQDSCTGDEYGPGFPVTGNWTTPVYAVSVAGTLPSSCITWYQAEQACRLADKRLLTNAEWQAAAAGTPDPGTDDDGVSTCATASVAPALSGARAGCISNWGAHDMVGNLWEWVANWTDQGVGCASFADAYGGDISCAGGNVVEPTPATTPAAAGSTGAIARPAPVRPADVLPISPHFPAAMTRGGNFSIGLRSGVFATYTGAVPFSVSRGTGFRCGR
jgi:hypothetical protein